MMSDIPNDVANLSSECQHDHSCLISGMCGSKPMCDVISSHADYVLVLKTRESSDCPYRLSIRGRQLCSCPTHVAMKNEM